ncbi:SDR family NAD(P)-dependent oxidoreductase, partial [Acinetobacter baumannii]
MTDPLCPFASKTALVTGSSKGLGRAIARRVAERGADIVINYRSGQADAEAVKAEAEAHGVRAIAIQADVSTTAGIDSLFDQAMAA